MEATKTITLPISKLSYSSLTQLLRNPIIFKMKYILGVYETKVGVSGMIGRAGHEALKTYYGANPEVKVPKDNKPEAIAIAKETGLKYLADQNDNYIDYGKTGSREQMLKGYAQAMDFYFAEEPEYHEILMVEEKMTADVRTVNGDLLPLPLTGIPDLVHKRKDGAVEIIDTKFVTNFTPYEDEETKQPFEDYIKIIQAQFMYHLLLAAKGIKAERILFREIKRTLNSKDQAGKPQVRDYAIPFDHEPYRIIFYNLFRDVVEFLSQPKPIFLPNLSDNFDGEQAGLIYAQGLINADMSDVEVMHKVRDVAFTTKKFVTSRLDSEENKDLLPEEKIKVRLGEFGIPVEPVETKFGASLTQYRFKVSAGVRMSTIKKHKDDIAMALGAKGNVNIVAPIPGTTLVGVEVDNENRTMVALAPSDFQSGTLMLPIGVDVHGNHIRVPLDEMPHLLIAGATGSGKSVLLNCIITALTEQMQPSEMEMVLIDPKRVELSAFADKPHLKEKVIYEYEDAVRVLIRLKDEMERRYAILEKAHKHNISEYNMSRRSNAKQLPYIVVVIDEFADLIIRASIEEKKRKVPAYRQKSRAWLYKEIIEKRKLGNAQQFQRFNKQELVEFLEENDVANELNRPDANVELLLVRLAQMARAVGIHLIIATQRPSVDVITGLIKANFPTRIALTTASPTDSTIILGVPGAEKLSGKGDMLFSSPSAKGIQRLQGFYYA